MMMDQAASVLVVDDEINNLEMLSRRLQRHGYCVETSQSGEEALHRLMESSFDAVLLDIMMPGLDGLTVLRRLRARTGSADLPVIMVTAKSAAEDTAEAFDCGADDFVSKPIDLRVLLSRLRSQIARYRAQRHLENLNLQLNEKVERGIRHLRDAESQLTTLAENLPVVLWRLKQESTQDAGLMYFHGAVENVLGFPSEQRRGDLETFLELLHPEDRERVAHSMHTLLHNGAPIALDIRIPRSGQKDRWLHLAARLSNDDHRQIDGILMDVTDRKLLEAQLLHTQKLESVGQLASGIAHEINSPAQYTRDNVGFLRECFEQLVPLVRVQHDILRQMRLDEDQASQLQQASAQADLEFLLEEVPAAVDQSLEGIDRISRIVNAMKGFTHPGSDEAEACDINKLIEDTIAISRNEWKYVAELHRELDPGIPFVSCFPSELAQVILNLIVNAAHAIQEKVSDGCTGNIRVSTCYLPEQSQVVIRITDDGPGIPAGIRNRIFDPFFTTKPVGKGTGQGLAIARSVINGKHRGSLNLEDSETGGAAFIVTIPA